nr:MAG TPA: hypothetical protein [Caudoviricetes sp.]
MFSIGLILGILNIKGNRKQIRCTNQLNILEFRNFINVLTKIFLIPLLWWHSCKSVTKQY